MLRNISRALTSKQTIMADHSSIASSTQECSNSPSSLFGTPTFFQGLRKGTSDTDSAMISPISTLDTKLFFDSVNPFLLERNIPRSPKTSKDQYTSEKGIGLALALIGSENGENPKQNSSERNSRMVLLGSKLKVQIPPLPPFSFSPNGSPESPSDFGIKTRNSQLGSPNFGMQTEEPPGIFTGCLTVSEMELSEEYTCVISHGPNPRTTHIFDNCIVGSCPGVARSPSLRRKECSSMEESNARPGGFLCFCYTCKKSLDHEKDIFIYRGEKAFCSQECRGQEMMLDGMEHSDSDDSFGTAS